MKITLKIFSSLRKCSYVHFLKLPVKWLFIHSKKLWINENEKTQVAINKKYCLKTDCALTYLLFEPIISYNIFLFIEIFSRLL